MMFNQVYKHSRQLAIHRVIIVLKPCYLFTKLKLILSNNDVKAVHLDRTCANEVLCGVLDSNEQRVIP